MTAWNGCNALIVMGEYALFCYGVCYNIVSESEAKQQLLLWFGCAVLWELIDKSTGD